MTPLLPWLAIGISLVSIAASVFFARQAMKFQNTQFRISREREIFDWAVKTLALLQDLRSSEPARVKDGRARLSAQIDIGRLLFPNDHAGSEGIEKPAERRGLRSHVLDPLVEIHKLDIEGKDSSYDIDDLQRKFTYYVGKNFTPLLTDTSPEALAAKDARKGKARQ